MRGGDSEVDVGRQDTSCNELLITPSSILSSQLPAIVVNPPVITACISDLVILARYGLIRSGASVCPRKMLAAAFMDSQAVVPSVTWSSQPTFPTTQVIVPR